MSTRAHAFFPANAEQRPLFAVVAGVPANDALNQVSALLSAARDAASSSPVLQEESSNHLWATVYLLDMAIAVVEATVRG